jgi:chemotaxis protein methyltransferase CheR
MAFTYFFRDLHVLELAIEHLVPAVMGRSKPRVWDAGCATGPEPYSVAILLAESMGKSAFRNLQVVASDHDEGNNFDSIITEGVYPADPLSRIPKDLFEKYFVPADREGHFQLIDLIRDRVSFRTHDLLSLEPLGEDFSLVVCKNVLLHFKPAERVEVIRMFHRSLAPGGLFVTDEDQKLPEGVARLFTTVVTGEPLHKKVGR